MLKTSFSLVECFGRKHSVWTLRAWMEMVRNSCGLCSDLQPCKQQASKSITGKSSMLECGKGPRLKESNDVFTSEAKRNKIAEKSIRCKNP